MRIYGQDCKLDALLGKTLISVTPAVKGDDEIRFVTDDGRTYVMHHCQDCCETVMIEDITGDLQDLVGSPILRAEESSSDASGPDVYDSGTWTFYKFATHKGYVDIRWLGTSNGYYSEGVSFTDITDRIEEE